MHKQQTFTWQKDGWGQIQADWGKAKNTVATYFRRLRKPGGCKNGGPSLEGVPVSLQFPCLVVRDLVSIGWELKIRSDGTIWIRRADGFQDKDSVRSLQIGARNEQLRMPSVRKFVLEIEKRKLTKCGWHSIFSIMRDGSEFRQTIEDALAEGDLALKQAIDPYIQFVEPDLICDETGLKLMDIWRYFRHTWVTPYNSVPGRSFPILFRDRSILGHPVIGIACLGSAVIHQTSRDRLIGWETETFLQRLISHPTSKLAIWLIRSIERLINEVYSLDLIRDGLVNRTLLECPTQTTIDGLISESERAKEEHHSSLQRDRSAGMNASRIQESDFDDIEATNWEEKSEAPLFRSKRCRLMADLLRIRLAMRDSGFVNPTKRALHDALESPSFRSAVKSLVARLKGESVGIHMMDITVCGALPPYSDLLGGKLVAMLLCSPEVSDYFRRRYSKSPSLIATGLAGKPVYRKPRLVCMATTSLYQQQSSQYNRIVIPIGNIGGDSGKIEYRIPKEGDDTGRSKGYGTFHFREDTMRALERWESEHGIREVNYIFGEGTSPKLRRLRSAIDGVGLPGDGAMLHKRARIVYYVQLTENPGDFMLGIDRRPKWLVPQKDPEGTTERIIDWWRERWFTMRASNPEVLARIGSHSLAYPVQHGARVQLPEDRSNPDEDELLWE